MCRDGRSAADIGDQETGLTDTCTNHYFIIFFAVAFFLLLNKKLSCRKKTVLLLRATVLVKYNWKTIFCGHYRSIFNHCNVIDLESYRIR